MSVCKEKQKDRQKGMLCGKFEGVTIEDREAFLDPCRVSEVVHFVKRSRGVGPFVSFWNLVQPKCTTLRTNYRCAIQLHFQILNSNGNFLLFIFSVISYLHMLDLNQTNFFNYYSNYRATLVL